MALAVTPLDVAKVRLQNAAPSQQPAVHNAVYHSSSSSGAHHAQLCPSGCGALVWKDARYRGRNMSSVAAEQHHAALQQQQSERSITTLQMLRKIWTEEGIAGLYRGIRPTLLMSLPNTMIYYTCYDELVQYVRASVLPAAWQGYAPLVSGGAARWLSSSATAPLEFLRTREASSNTKSVSSLRHIIQTEGFWTVYKGLAPTLWRDVPFSAIYWLTIEELRVVWKQHYDNTGPSNVSEQFAQSFINGFIAGTVSACLTTPFDVVKTRQQAGLVAATANQASSSSTSCSHNGASPIFAQQQQQQPKPSSPQGTWRALYQVFRAEGVAGLWRGNWARTAKVAPSCAIMISSYEVGKRLLLPAESYE